jgi:hypothetical protein
MQPLTHLVPAADQRSIRDRTLVEIEHPRGIIVWMQSTDPAPPAGQQHEGEATAVSPRVATHQLRQRHVALSDP